MNIPSIYIALGANLSNPKRNFVKAISELRRYGIVTTKTSSLWHSPAWPAGKGHPDYVNAVIAVQTSLMPDSLLEKLHKIEESFGRERKTVNAPRPLDLDIVDYKGQVETGKVTLPHPRMMARPFVLLPLLEIAQSWSHPRSGLTAVDGVGRLPTSDVLAHHIIERNWINVKGFD